VRALRRTAELVLVSEDRILRAALEHELSCTAKAVAILNPDAIGVLCNDDALSIRRVAVVDPWVRVGPDYLHNVNRVADLAAAMSVIAVSRTMCSDLQTLRLVEAGTTFLYPYDLLAWDPQVLIGAIEEPDERFRLPTRWELRERLGLRWDGDIESFLAHLEDVPASVFDYGAKQVYLPIGRRETRRIRILARDLAGLPAPDFRLFSSSHRSAPDCPDWTTTCRFVRSVRGIDESRADAWTARR
jgi:hypothetical protein